MTRKQLSNSKKELRKLHLKDISLVYFWNAYNEPDDYKFLKSMIEYSIVNGGRIIRLDVNESIQITEIKDPKNVSGRYVFIGE